MRWFLGIAALTALSSSVDARRERKARSISFGEFLKTVEVQANTTALELFIDVKDLKARNATAPYLYGLMFEDINYSGDGGIYAELIKNRAFQGSSVKYGELPDLEGNSIIETESPSAPFKPTLNGWAPIGNVRLSLDSLHPLSEALPTVMQIDIPKGVTGEVGFKNFGWWGMDVRPQTYAASFYVLANAPRKRNKSTRFTLSLQSNVTGETWASTTIEGVDVPSLDFVQLNTTITNSDKTAPNANNTFAITMDASQVAGQTLYFGLISLFPETFKGRKNGLRKDLGEAFHDLKPKFLRFPGGNNLEGISVATRWKWWKTIGPLKERPGRPGNWGYQNTDGLGLLEYLEWCEDMSIEPVLAIYAGFSLDSFGQKGTSYPASQMPSIIQEALDELEYCMGATSTKYGALRAQHGHPVPFNIKFIEIGNEDWFSDDYPMRWGMMYEALKKLYPDFTLISTTYDENTGYKMKLPPGTIWDTHHYEEPHYFLQNFNFWDNWQVHTNNTDVGILLGEYSVFQIDTPSGSVDFKRPKDKHFAFPRMLSAIAEGVYALGGERNPNTVKMSSYAPSLQNLNAYQWDPDMLHFTANYQETILSTSYWQQWIFARFRGTHTLPVIAQNGKFNPLFWAASIDVPRNIVYLKMINASPTPQHVNLTLLPYKTVNGTILSHSDPHAFNSLANKTGVRPQPLENTWRAREEQTKGRIEWEVKAWSLNVLEFALV